MKHTLFALMIFSATAARSNTPAPACTALPFGAANYFNLFVLDNVNHHDSDTEGRVAVGGHASFSHYSLGKKVSTRDGGPTYALVVGKSLSFKDGSIWNAYIGYGQGASFVRTGFARSYAAPHSVPVAIPEAPISGGFIDYTDRVEYYAYKKSLIDFSDAQFKLGQLSRLWREIPSNAPASKPGGRIILTGIDSTLNVFDVNADDFALVSEVLVDVPASSTVLVNVSGKKAVFKNFGFTLVNVSSEKVIFNMPDVTSIEMNGVGAKGTFLAPLAFVDFSNGSMNGTLIAHDFEGNGQMNVSQFSGCLPALAQ